ncbi:MAG: chemotaxis protein [Thaumarchaeota archaeon]|nr:chemotaxis protein [Nitrososphaerota archaeon]
MTKPKREAKPRSKDSAQDVVKKMTSISDATKTLASEVKTMSKIFVENQKILISLKDMITTVNSSLDQIQKNSRQINIIEEDTQRLFSGMSQVKAHSNMIDKINNQITRLQDHAEKIRDKQESMPDTNKIMQSIADNIDSTRNNTKMIMHISEKTEKVREEIKNVAQTAESLVNLSTDVEELRKSTSEISSKTESLVNLRHEIEEVRQNTKEIASKTEKMSALEENITGLKEEVGSVITKTDSIIPGLESQIRNVGAEIDFLIKKTDSISELGNDIRNINSEFSNFRENVIGKNKDLDEKISDFAELLNKNSAAITEFNKKTYEISQQLQDIKHVTHKTSQNTSHEVMGLLRLSEFQSKIRMRSESKYGTLEDIEKMADQTKDMINLFDRISIETETKIPLPLEVKQWSISKILDCADRWEIRFTDVFRMMITELGSDIVKEAIRIEQVRDLFGIRAVDEIRRDLNIS